MATTDTDTGIDLAWAVRRARTQIAGRVARDRQAEAFASYGRNWRGEELVNDTAHAPAYLLEAMAGERAYAGELALEELDGYCRLVGVDPTQED